MTILWSCIDHNIQKHGQITMIWFEMLRSICGHVWLSLRLSCIILIVSRYALSKIFWPRNTDHLVGVTFVII